MAALLSAKIKCDHGASVSGSAAISNILVLFLQLGHLCAPAKTQICTWWYSAMYRMSLMKAVVTTMCLIAAKVQDSAASNGTAGECCSSVCIVQYAM